MSTGEAHPSVKWMRWSARTICLILTIFVAFMLIGGAVSEFFSQGSIATSLEGNLLITIGLVALTGCVLSWWRDLPAGILLVLTSAGLGAHIGAFAGRNHILVWLMLGLPYLVAGILLLYARRLSR